MQNRKNWPPRPSEQPKKTRPASRINSFEILRNSSSRQIARFIQEAARKKDRRLSSTAAQLLVHPNEQLREVAIDYFSELGIAKAIPHIQKCLKDSSRPIRAQAFLALGKLSALKNKNFFKRLDRQLGKEIQKNGISIILKARHEFPDGFVYPSDTLPGAHARRVLEIRSNGKGICVIGFFGNTIEVIQGIPVGFKLGKYFETAVNEYLNLLKPVISPANPAYLNDTLYGAFSVYRFILERYFDQAGILNFKKHRVKIIFGKK